MMDGRQLWGVLAMAASEMGPTKVMLEAIAEVGIMEASCGNDGASEASVDFLSVPRSLLSPTSS